MLYFVITGTVSLTLFFGVKRAKGNLVEAIAALIDRNQHVEAVKRIKGDFLLPPFPKNSVSVQLLNTLIDRDLRLLGELSRVDAAYGSVHVHQIQEIRMKVTQLCEHRHQQAELMIAKENWFSHCLHIKGELHRICDQLSSLV